MKMSVASSMQLRITDLSGVESDAILKAIADNPDGDVGVLLEVQQPVGGGPPSEVIEFDLVWTTPSGGGSPSPGVAK
jgi:hypothetical protein